MSEDELYRRGVGVMLLNREGKVFVGPRIDNSDEAWQMPQGGIDEGEEPWATAQRELEEETGIPPHLVERIAQCPERLRYDSSAGAGRHHLEGAVGRPGPGLVSWPLPWARRRREHRHQRTRNSANGSGSTPAQLPELDRAVQARPLPPPVAGLRRPVLKLRSRGVAFAAFCAARAVAMAELSSSERAVVERAGAEPMLDQVLGWAAVNSGSRNLAGLERMADLLVDAFSALPGVLRLERPGKG